MNIPSRVNPFGYDNTVPPGYTRAEFLESNGATRIFTDIPFSKNTGLKIKFIPFSNVDVSIICFASAGSNGLVCFTALHKNYLRFSLSYISYVPLREGGYVNSVGNLGEGKTGYIIENELTVAELNWQGSGEWSANWGQEELRRPLPISLNDLGDMELFAQDVTHYFKGRLFYAGVSEGIHIAHKLVPVLDSTGAPCVYDLVRNQPFYNVGPGAFTVGLTTKQAINLVHLPVPTTINTLTVSLPLEAAFDANVQDALNTAADKGWTITVQYRESELTTKNIPADFLESTGTQLVQTPYAPPGYTRCTVRLFEKNKLQLMGCNNNTLKWGSTANNNYRIALRELPKKIGNKDVVTFRVEGAYAAGVMYLSINNENFEEPYVQNGFEKWKFFTTTLSQDVGCYCRLYQCGCYNLSDKLLFFAIPALDSTGTPCMYDTVSGQNFYNANTAEGATPFTVGFDTTEKAAISISKLPITTDGTLTVSLPAAAQDASSLVPEAITIATNRGWTIITQYRED